MNKIGVKWTVTGKYAGLFQRSAGDGEGNDARGEKKNEEKILGKFRFSR